MRYVGGSSVFKFVLIAAAIFGLESSRIDAASTSATVTQETSSTGYWNEPASETNPFNQACDAVSSALDFLIPNSGACGMCTISGGVPSLCCPAGQCKDWDGDFQNYNNAQCTNVDGTYACPVSNGCGCSAANCPSGATPTPGGGNRYSGFITVNGVTPTPTGVSCTASQTGSCSGGPFTAGFTVGGAAATVIASCHSYSGAGQYVSCTGEVTDSGGSPVGTFSCTDYGPSGSPTTATGSPLSISTPGTYTIRAFNCDCSNGSGTMSISSSCPAPTATPTNTPTPTIPGATATPTPTNTPTPTAGPTNTPTPTNAPCPVDSWPVGNVACYCRSGCTNDATVGAGNTFTHNTNKYPLVVVSHDSPSKAVNNLTVWGITTGRVWSTASGSPPMPDYLKCTFESALPTVTSGGIKVGCTYKEAVNYDPTATIEAGYNDPSRRCIFQRDYPIPKRCGATFCGGNPSP